MTDRIDRARRPTGTSALVVFRIALGAIVSVSALRFLWFGWVDELFVRPTFHFKYWGFSWVEPLSPPAMHVLFAVIAVLGACFAAGMLFRLVAPVLFLLFSYVQLVDVTNWLNHYYLVSLLLLLSSVMPLGRASSVDALLWPKARVTSFPWWCTWLLRFQVAVVYVSAGLAKLTRDWLLHAQPLDIWLHARCDVPWLGALFDERWVAYAFSWGGFLFDTSVVAFLLWRKTRPIAYGVLVAFHVTVGLLFPIGMFPFVMMAAALVFFPPDQFWRSAADQAVVPVAPRHALAQNAWRCLAVAYVAVQILLPLRHHVYGGNVLWHEQGMRFSWRVMAREKNGSVMYVVEAPAEKRTWFVNPSRYLTDRQERELQGQPDLIVQLAHHIQRDFHRKGHGDVRVRAEVLVSLNGRGAARLIDPAVDLGSVPDGIGKAAYVLPEPQGPPIHLAPWNGVRLASRSGS
jgi:vitamin K-dependent gamma-carboxylase